MDEFVFVFVCMFLVICLQYSNAESAKQIYAFITISELTGLSFVLLSNVLKFQLQNLVLTISVSFLADSQTTEKRYFLNFYKVWNFKMETLF